MHEACLGLLNESNLLTIHNEIRKCNELVIQVVCENESGIQ